MNNLLKSLLDVHSPSGEEINMKQFILNYVNENSEKWKVKPQVIHGEEFQDCLMLIFGKPEVAAFAHMDTTGFTVRYRDQLIPIGGPDVKGDEILTGSDVLGEIECSLTLNEEYQLHYNFGRAIKSGTSLVYKSNFLEDSSYYSSPYLDNRVGIYNLLKLAENLENGALVFSSWEEHGGGSVPFIVKFLYEKYSIRKMLVSDVTWVSDGIGFDEGVVVSFRDKNIPRKSFIDSITSLAIENQVPFQVEVEAHGSSDAREIQLSPYPIDWCFIGPPIENAHSTLEKVSKKDLLTMISLYQILMNQL
jgi:putative aminopeptidase FrvX